MRVEQRIVVELGLGVELRRLPVGLGPDLLLGPPGCGGRLGDGNRWGRASGGEQRDESAAPGASRRAIVQFFSASVCRTRRSSSRNAAASRAWG